jgi:hypothetical protein
MCQDYTFCVIFHLKTTISESKFNVCRTKSYFAFKTHSCVSKLHSAWQNHNQHIENTLLSVKNGLISHSFVIKLYFPCENHFKRVEITLCVSKRQSARWSCIRACQNHTLCLELSVLRVKATLCMLNSQFACQNLIYACQNHTHPIKLNSWAWKSHLTSWYQTYLCQNHTHVCQDYTFSVIFHLKTTISVSKLVLCPSKSHSGVSILLTASQNLSISKLHFWVSKLGWYRTHLC